MSWFLAAVRAIKQKQSDKHESQIAMGKKTSSDPASRVKIANNMSWLIVQSIKKAWKKEIHPKAKVAKKDVRRISNLGQCCGPRKLKKKEENSKEKCWKCQLLRRKAAAARTCT